MTPSPWPPKRSRYDLSRLYRLRRRVIVAEKTAAIVRKLDDEIYGRLRDRATRKGVSMEEEARQILTRAVSPP